MLVCSNHSEVTDGGPCLQAFLTIEQYGLGGKDSGRSLPASRQAEEAIFLQPRTRALKCQCCVPLTGPVWSERPVGDCRLSPWSVSWLGPCAELSPAPFRIKPKESAKDYGSLHPAPPISSNKFSHLTHQMLPALCWVGRLFSMYLKQAYSISPTDSVSELRRFDRGLITY